MDSGVDTSSYVERFRLEAWAIGLRGAFGLLAGPFYSEKEALETEGEDGQYIIHFLPDGTDELAWIWEKDRWKRVDPNSDERGYNESDSTGKCYRA